MELSLTTEYRHLQAFWGPKTGLIMINSTFSSKLTSVHFPLDNQYSLHRVQVTFCQLERIFRQELELSIKLDRH